MSAGNLDERAAQFAAWWVRCYTTQVGAEAAESRRAEIASDLWEQRTHGRSVDAPPLAVGVSIVRRTVAGIPADLIWSRMQRAAARGRSPLSEGTPMSLSSQVRQYWWSVLAVLAGALQVVVGIWLLIDQTRIEDAVAQAFVIAGLGVLIMAGVAVRRRRRVLGDGMIIAGLLPSFVYFWLVYPALLALVVAVAAAVDIADAVAVQGARRTPMVLTAVGVTGLFVAFVAGMLGAVGLFVVAASAVVVVIVGAVVLGTRRRRARLAA